MNKRTSSLFLAAALTAAIGLAVSDFAAAEKPVVVVTPEIEAAFNSGFTPKVLSKATDPA